MILILNWGYQEGADPLLDLLQAHPTIDNLIHLSNGSGLNLRTLNRRLKKLREEGLLITYRYRHNNFIWMIGSDAEEKYSSYDALQIARYRRYISFGADQEEFDTYTSEEKENILNDVGVFPSEREELMGKPEYHAPRTKKEQAHFEKINRLLSAKTLETKQELHDYVDKLWEDN